MILQAIQMKISNMQKMFRDARLGKVKMRKGTSYFPLFLFGKDEKEGKKKLHPTFSPN